MRGKQNWSCMSKTLPITGISDTWFGIKSKKREIKWKKKNFKLNTVMLPLYFGPLCGFLGRVRGMYIGLL